MGYGELKRVVLCAPGNEFFNVQDFLMHHLNPGINRNKATEQFRIFENTLAELGVEVLRIKELEGHPNSVFVRDTAVIVNGGFIKVNMGLLSRKGEEKWMARFLEESGFKKYGEIVSPGTVEGGDVIIGEDTAFVGISERTNENGAEQITKILRLLEFEVRVIRFKGPFLHIGGGMSLIGNKTVIYCENAFLKKFFEGFRSIEISCNDFIGGNIVAINENTVIAEKRNFTVISKLRNLGFNVLPLDLSEFVKGNGGPSCMVLPIG